MAGVSRRSFLQSSLAAASMAAFPRLRLPGGVLGALDDAGQRRDTFVVFTSDNGGERYSYNWPASEAKVSLHEGSIRVPAIVRWPGRVAAGRATDQTVIMIDQMLPRPVATMGR